VSGEKQVVLLGESREDAGHEAAQHVHANVPAGKRQSMVWWKDVAGELEAGDRADRPAEGHQQDPLHRAGADAGFGAGAAARLRSIAWLISVSLSVT
jgi:hypothetical protein